VGDLYYPLFKGRDGCRTPMPWDAAKPSWDYHRIALAALGPEHLALAVSNRRKTRLRPQFLSRPDAGEKGEPGLTGW
jgi:alpha-glucosidase